LQLEIPLSTPLPQPPAPFLAFLAAKAAPGMFNVLISSKSDNITKVVLLLATNLAAVYRARESHGQKALLCDKASRKAGNRVVICPCFVAPPFRVEI